MRGRKVESYSVSGPGTDRAGIPALGAAISWAQRRAELAKKEATFYVRDVAGVVLARIEREKDGSVSTYPIRRAA